MPTTLPNEIWLPIPGYDGKYLISNLGRVCSLLRRRPRILRPSWGTGGYRCLLLYSNKVPKTVRIHRLVAEVFLPKPAGDVEVNHKNGDKTDNRAENLEWITHSENCRHAWKTGLQPRFRFGRGLQPGCGMLF